MDATTCGIYSPTSTGKSSLLPESSQTISAALNPPNDMTSLIRKDNLENESIPGLV
jgi:hypothetical protein